MTTQQTCNKLNLLFQNDIKKKGLVKSGKLLKSIKWIFNDGNFSMLAEDYYEFIDKEHNITQDVTNSLEFKQTIDKFYANYIEEQIAQELKK